MPEQTGRRAGLCRGAGIDGVFRFIGAALFLLSSSFFLPALLPVLCKASRNAGQQWILGPDDHRTMQEKTPGMTGKAAGEVLATRPLAFSLTNEEATQSGASARFLPATSTVVSIQPHDHGEADEAPPAKPEAPVVAEAATPSNDYGEDSSIRFPEFEKIPARQIGGVSTGVNVQVASGHPKGDEAEKPVVHGHLTASKYAEILLEDLRKAEQVHAVPIIRIRWHTHPDFLRKAAELVSSTGEHYFFITLGDSAHVESSTTQDGLFRPKLPEKLAPINWTDRHEACPFQIPTFDEIMKAFSKFDLTLLRWAPYPLISNPTDEEPSGIRTEGEFVNAVARSLPSEPFLTKDGRKVALVIHDKLPELRYLFNSAAAFAPNGTPVFMTNSDGGRLNGLLPRLNAKMPDGSPVAFLTISYERGCHPFDEAFLDHSVVRVPTSDDLQTFVNKSKQETTSSGNPAIISLNPFQDLLMRFNYKEVESIDGYVAELERTMKESPIRIDIRNITHTVAIVVLSQSPEQSLVYFKGSSKLNLAFQLTLAILMLIALLSCFCMCRFVCLVKSKVG